MTKPLRSISQVRNRRGYTLLELVITLPLMTILIIGSTGAIGVVARIAEGGSNAAETTMRAPAALEWMAAEIECATAVTARSTMSLSVVTSDRTGDGIDDSIAFAWSGAIGDPLTRQLNGGPPESLLDNVQSLSFLQNTVTSGTSLVLQSIDLRVTLASSAGELTTRVRLLNEPVAP